VAVKVPKLSTDNFKYVEFVVLPGVFSTLPVPVGTMIKHYAHETKNFSTQLFMQ